MKKEIRKKMIEKRNALSKEEVLEKSKIISEKVINDEEYKKAENVLIYIDFKGEVCTRFIIEDALKNNKKVFIPKIKDNAMIFYKFDGYESLESGYYGISEPKDDAVLFEDNCEFVVITPGVVFDKSNNRIGFGKGFYDRFFKKVDVNKKIGVCYKFQLVDNIKAEENDEKVDIVYTE